MRFTHYTFWSAGGVYGMLILVIWERGVRNDNMRRRETSAVLCIISFKGGNDGSILSCR